MKNKKILLIWPPANSVHGPPFGLASVAGHLRSKRPDISIKVVDLNVLLFNQALKETPLKSEFTRLIRSRWTQADIVQDALSRWAFGDDAPSAIGALPDWECHYLSILFGDTLDGFIETIDYQPDIIGFSVCDNGLIASIGLSEKLRKRFPKSLIVWGGVSMSEYQAQNFIKNISFIDIVVVGEGEQAIVEIVDSAPELPIESSCSILTRKTAKEIKAKREVYVPSEPSFDLFDLTLYPALEIPMTIARGCGWGRCNFCNETYASSKFQSIDPVRSAKWAIDWQQKYRPVSFDLIDSAANSNPQNFNDFVNTLIDGGGLREWRCMLRSSEIQKDSLEMAFKSGLRTVYFGIESLNGNILRKMNKGISILQHIQAIRTSLELGLNVEGDFIMFFPYDTAKAIYQTIDLIKQYEHLFQKISLSYSRFVPCINSNIGNNPEGFGIELLPFSLRLARHLPNHLSRSFVPWDPYWKYINGNNSQVKQLAKAYIELKNVLEELSTKKSIQRNWYELGNTVILESTGYQEQVLDRIFLEGKQRDIWLKCKQKISSEKLSKLTDVSVDAINKFLKNLAKDGFVFNESNNWIHTALNHTFGKYFPLRNVKSRPDPPSPDSELMFDNSGRNRID